jgi:hypothetical protein
MSDVLDDALAARAELTRRITDQLATLPCHQGLGIAVGVVIYLLKERQPRATREDFLRLMADCWDNREEP